MNLRRWILLGATFLCTSVPLSAQTSIITQSGSIIYGQHANSNPQFDFNKLFDKDPSTSFFGGEWTDNWIVYVAPEAVIVNSYVLTSAIDRPQFDPSSWVLEGGNDGTHWEMIDSRQTQTFDGRSQPKIYTVGKPGIFRLYRIHFTAANGGDSMHLAEWDLRSEAPATPAQMKAVATSAGITLRWKSGEPDITGYQLERSSDGVQYQPLAMLSAKDIQYTDKSACASSYYAYRLAAVNKSGASVPTKPLIIRSAKAVLLPDITAMLDGQTTGSFNGRATSGEGVDKLTDHNLYSKYFIPSTTGWMQYYLPGGAVTKQYAITSGNDYPGRDPKDWELLGSNDGHIWIVLDKQENQTFTGRNQRRHYIISNDKKFVYHRLKINANSGERYTQLSEWQLYGNGKGQQLSTKPLTPRQFAVTEGGAYQQILVWSDLPYNESGYRLQRSTDGVKWEGDQFIQAGDTMFYARNLQPNTTYHYRLQTENKFGRSAYVTAQGTTPDGEPPLVWQEHWFGHEEKLTRAYYDDDIAVYYDEAVDTAINWMFADFSQAWRYTKQNYGTFSDPRLYIVFHSVKKPELSGGHPAAVFNAHHDFRNVIDLSGDWKERSSWNVGATIHEIGHIVEGASKDVDRSPAFPLWGDSKWCEISGYDMVKRLGWISDVNRFYDDLINNSDDYPRAGTRWFKNWFYPLYNNSDSSATLNRFYDLLADYYPKRNGGYARDLNMGEFIHFWSGAARTDLKELAIKAFGWNDFYEMQLLQAREEFPFKYEGKYTPGAFTRSTTLSSRKDAKPRGGK
ncbi:fibronectin type III domain-containing protein [Chitinophaga rhizophila]|uniref:Fibronectin type-III domain-containing protein n=1 Tax=Chitinophaga rhizophila TaxID=2866212 RepID=A0ABS7G7E3_9BACT|nr:fibronectin type III domain-containing protein [Chitinophaga rhizophila]MBW8683576.1 hypothetical protein [Chitinophaga rhizophila]